MNTNHSLAVRSSGVLLHVTSLPGPHGCGDLGPAAHRFVDFLATSGQRWWQVLPTGPVDAGGSPYNSTSAFAGGPLLVSIEALAEEGLLTRREAAPLAGAAAGRVDYPRVVRHREAALQRAWLRFQGSGASARGRVARFADTEAAWLEPYCVFAALRDSQGDRPWWRWPRGLRLAERRPLREARRSLQGRIDYHRFVQYLFHRHWRALRAHCRAAGVALMGDIPIFVAHDSSDVWANRDLFCLDRDGRARVVSGAAPDDFSRTGQLWGHPLYRWTRHRATGYGWWVDRFARTFEQFDAARIDHFLGFSRYWEVPAGHRTARRGRWRRSPGAELFETLRRRLGDKPIIAEDLGLLTRQAAALRDRFGFPGMRVLQCGFGSDDNYHVPHNLPPGCVVYTGTHDNDTASGWLRQASRRPDANGISERDRALAFTGATAKTFAWDLARLAHASVAHLAIVPVQDLLGLGSSARMNVPGTIKGNWSWRVARGALNGALAGRLRTMTRMYGRIVG